MFKHILIKAQASKTIQFLKPVLFQYPKQLVITLLILLGLSACDNTTVSANSGERYVFFVQYTNAAFGADFRALYINSEGEVIKAEDSVLPDITLDGVYTQQQLDDYYFPNQSIQAQLSAQPMDDLIGYKGLVECLGHSAAKRIADRIAAYSEKPRHFEIVNSKIDGGNIINFGQFSDKTNVTEAKMGSALAQWLIGRAVYVFEKKQWMIWNGCYWEADQRSIITKLAYQFVTEAKEALFDRGKFSDLSNLSQFESLNRLENIARFATTDCSVSATEFDTDPLLLASSSIWIDLGSGSSMAPNPKKLVSKALAVKHDQQATCPTFLQFLNDVFEI